MYYSQIRKLDASNGFGIRTTLFVSGCTFDCKGCFNQEAQNFTNGELWTEDVENQFIEYTKNPNIVGVNLLGGEIMQQDSAIILHLVKRIKEETGKSIWMWTGYTLEELYKMPDKMEILQYVDVLIDGRFELDKKDLMLKYRGSSNQRVINIQESLKYNKVILYTEQERSNVHMNKQEFIQNYINYNKANINIGDISDGYHTFDELYYHRMVLFSIICNTHKEYSWKSWKHHDDTMYDDYFIVGITIDGFGDYTYHYHKDYWDMFMVKELAHAPVWDGHKPSDIDRLFSLYEK